MLARYLRDLCAIAEGDAAAGPVALLPASERFHRLTAPCSNVIQCGRIHSGLAEDPAAELDRLFAAHAGTSPADSLPSGRLSSGASSCRLRSLPLRYPSSN